MKQQKQNQKGEYKVKCTIRTSNHEKICYPCEGDFNACSYLFTLLLFQL